MFFIALITAVSKLVFWNDVHVLKSMFDALMAAARTGFELAIYLTGVLCLWMGIMKIGEKAGAIDKLAWLVKPLFSKIFPDVPKNHPAVGSIMMNFSANMLGLDNAATPLGLKAMNDLQELNPEKEKASNAQIMFLVLNTSGLTIIPVSVFALLGTINYEESVSIVFLPILVSTFFASLAGLIIVAIKQRINLFNKIVLAYIGTLTLLISLLLYYVISNPSKAEVISEVGGNALIFGIIATFIIMGMRKKLNVYESFIEGAKGGFDVAVKIIPYLIGILAVIAMLRSSGALDAFLDGLKEIVIWCGITVTEWVDALPVGIMKPLSGGGARGALTEIMDNYDKLPNQELIAAGKKIPMSMQTKIGATMQGSTETTLYVLAVYFGSVGIRNSRYAAVAGLLCDLIGIITAIIVAYIFFG
ncbi:MAG: nucleoside recognition domain-containing protein [Crocinitomicaceae bacterium]